jgi:hypothetical protein
MAQFTPSALTVQSIGSMNMTIAHVNANVLSGTDFWSSGLTDIKSIQISTWGTPTGTPSNSACAVSWTSTSGVIHITKPLISSGTGAMLWIVSGGPSTLN